MRKLASIQKVLKLEPIVGADQIEKATILGWELVVKRGEFKVGDLCVYCEADSILPEKKEFEFLRERGFRIKTIKLKKQVSQGIAFPLSILPNKSWKEGDDVTETIGVKKHDPQAEFERRNALRLSEIEKNRYKKFFGRFAWYRRIISDRLPFPAFIQKTDEDRIQLFPTICDDERNTLFTVTEKLDGQSASFFLLKNKGLSRLWNPYIFGVCSRNFQLLKPDGQSYWKIAVQLDIKNKLIELSKLIGDVNVCIQGEIVGEGVQQNKLGLSGLDFYIFNMFEISGSNAWMPYNMMRGYADYLGLKCVPLLADSTQLLDSIPKMVEYAKGYSTIANKVLREGIVVRNNIRRISFKVINPDFLIKYND